MRFPINPRPGLSAIPILQVELNLQCRDEIIPILRGLQFIYGDTVLRQEILRLIGQDVNRSSSRKRGRKGMEYWQIMVLAAVRLGCNLDYDKLQDLAEQHRALRQIMGIADWDVHVRFDWRCIRDNIDWLRPKTLQKINDLIVAAGHQLLPKSANAVRGDSFVVETNVHYPTDSSLLGDGLRKILQIGGTLAQFLEVPGWRQHQHLIKKVRGLVRDVGKAARSKGRNKSERVQIAYGPLFQLADDLLARARELEWRAARFAALEIVSLRQQLQHFRQMTERVIGYSKRRVHHPGIESAINALQAGNGLRRCRDRTRAGYERYVGLGVLVRNLHVLGKVLLAREAHGSQAAQSKRKRLIA